MTKNCNTCGTEKDESEFNKGVGHLCRKCQSEKARKYLKGPGGRRNKERCRDRYAAKRSEYAERGRQLRALKQAFLRDAKSGACVECGNSFPSVVMDFDHVRGEKLANVSRLVQGTYSLEAVKMEIGKCDLVCANCHRIRTAERKRK